MYRSLLTLSFLSLGWLLASAQDAAQPKIYRYSTPTYVGDELITINHYRFDDRIMHLRSIDQYSSVESEQGDFIRFDSPGESGCSITFRFIRLNEMPKDEAAAIKLYDGEITKVSRLTLKGAKKDNRLNPGVGNFRRSYYMVSAPLDPVQEICTFFVQSPYLYIVQINSLNPVRATHIGHCAKMLKSLSIENREKQPGTSPIQVNNANQSTETAGTSAPAKVDESSAAINKMISDAFGSGSPTTGYKQVGGEGISSLDSGSR
jgi:hypothetical protein